MPIKRGVEEAAETDLIEEADTEGHGWRAFKIEEADTEGHGVRVRLVEEADSEGQKRIKRG